ncbi:MAG: ankyrin repeat domain-containing protein [Alphaproteobacteria bacterium]|nr:ankyrin repeat domain-containing protein [Alphaproteobacteria bacterium]
MELAHTKNNNMIPLIQFFLDNGVDVNARNSIYDSTIFTAVGTLEIAQFLLENGVDQNIVRSLNITPLMLAIEWERSNELIKLLIDVGLDLHVKSRHYGTALDTAKEKAAYLKNKQLDMSDGNEQYASLSARRKKAEEVVRIIAQALEAERKASK